MIRSTLIAFALVLLSGTALAAYDAQPRDNTTLQGSWRVNPAASDDVEQLVAKLMDKQEKERRRWRRQMEQEDPFALPDSLPNPRDSAYRSKQENALRNMLGVTKTLKVTQSGPDIEIASELGSRRFEAGSSSQASMPNGDLADARVGWDGESFVIDRKVPGRVRQVEKLRLIKKTGQLEYISTWSGGEDLSGVKLRRVFDPVTDDPTDEDPKLGPVR